MSLVTRYLLKELGIPFLLGIVLFTFVLLFGKFLKLTDLVVNQGVNLVDLVVFVFLGIPETFTIIVPMAMVLATLMAYGRLASDNEIIILRMTGYPLYSLLYPTLVVGLVISLALIGFSEYGAPQTSKYRQQRLAEMKQPDPVGLMKPKSYQSFGKFTIYADVVNGKNMKGVYIEDNRDERTKIILGKTGTWKKRNDHYELLLRDGSVHQKGKDVDQYRVLNFSEQTIQFNVFEPRSSADEETVTSITERWSLYEEARDRLMELTHQKDKDDEMIKRSRELYAKRGIMFHRSIAFPFASFFLTFIAAPIGMLAQQEGKSIGFTVSLGIIFSYYMITVLMEPLALNFWLSPGLAMWIANILFGGIGLCLYGWISFKGH